MLGLSIAYVVQPRPDGIAQSFLLAEQQINASSVALVLGDNLFFGYGFSQLLQKTKRRQFGATIFGYRVTDPERFGVIELDQNGKAVSIEEKPLQPKSNYAVTGLYFFDSQVVEFARDLTPSARGELEITDINRRYLEAGQLHVEILGRGFAWLDTGTHKTMADAGTFVNAIEARQGLKVACLEEIAYRNRWISFDMLKERSQELSKSDYGSYLNRLIIEVESQ